MEDHVIRELNKKDHSQELGDLLSHCKDLIDMSRTAMSNYYTRWDIADATYRGERCLDADDRKAIERGEPVKVVLPLTGSQVQTFKSFISSLFTQRDYLYELAGSGVEDEKPAKLAQACVERDLTHNMFRGVRLDQWLTDVARFGIGIFKSDWQHVTVPKLVQVPDPEWKPVEGMPGQAQPPMVEVYQNVTSYLGNRITVTSPYRWFPDTRLPLTRYREGEFCGEECDYPMPELQAMERSGQVAGLEDIPVIQADAVKNRRSPIFTPAYVSKQAGLDLDKRYVLVTEIQLRLNPAKTLISKGVYLDKRIDQEILHYVWIANDGRIIRLEPCGYDHEEFLHDMSQFSNDQARLLNEGLTDMLKQPQELLDWLQNSRVANVKKVINNQLVVHPAYVEFGDLKARNTVIRLKNNATPGLALNNYIQQLQVSDVTTGHITDMQMVSQFAKEATGISENLLGQYSSGRRSARQSADVNSSAYTRLQTVARALWESGLLPLGKKLISNLRQGLDEEQLVRVVGLQRFLMNSQPDQLTGISPVQSFIKVSKQQLVGNYDFLVFDATAPSQRAATAMALQELLVALSKDPRLILVFQKDPKLLLDEILELRNIRNPERFNLTPERAAELMQLAGGAANAGAAPNAGQPVAG